MRKISLENIFFKSGNYVVRLKTISISCITGDSKSNQKNNSYNDKARTIVSESPL